MMMYNLQLIRYTLTRPGLLLAVGFVIIISWNNAQRFYYQHHRVSTLIQQYTDVQSSGLLNNTTEHGAVQCVTTRRPAEKDVCLRPGKGGWQCYNHSITALYILKIFYDDRPLVKSPQLRIITVATQINISDTFCQVWYASSNHPLVTPSSNTGIVHIHHKVGRYKVGKTLFSCVLPQVKTKPTHVSLVTGRGPCGKSTILFPVTYPEGKGKPYEHEFGVCVPISYGTIHPVPLIEWIEMYRILGVTEINIYNCTVVRTPELERVLDHYQTQGVLRLHELSPPSRTWSSDGHLLATRAGINECMMTNMYKYRHTIVIDLDEVIVPKLDRNLTALLNRIDVGKGRTDSSGYSFRNVFFHKLFEQDESQPVYLRTMRCRRRWHPGGYLGKSILNPRKCLIAFNHYCLKQLPGVAHGVRVNIKMAASHHYRRCSGKLCKDRLPNPVNDDSILKFKDELNYSVLNLMNKLDISPPATIQ